MSASIEMRLAQSESCAFDDHRIYFCKPKEPSVHHQECVKDKAINHGQWFKPIPHVFSILVKCFFIVHHYGTNSDYLLNTAESIEMGLLARNETSTLPKFIKSRMA